MQTEQKTHPTGRKGSARIFGLVTTVMAITILGLFLTFNAMIVQDIQDDITDNTSTEYNVTVDTLASYETASGWQGTLMTIAIISVIILMLLGIFAFRGKEGFGA